MQHSKLVLTTKKQPKAYYYFQQNNSRHVNGNKQLHINNRHDERYRKKEKKKVSWQAR